MPDYRPIACAASDRLEHWALRGTPVDVVWREADGPHRQTAAIRDVFARDAADWVVLSTGETIRADRLVAVDGVEITPGC